MEKIIIDLTGPKGNAFFLIGYAKVLAKSEGYSDEEIKDLEKDMMSSDYEHLVKVFEFHFEDLIELKR